MTFFSLAPLSKVKNRKKRLTFVILTAFLLFAVVFILVIQDKSRETKPFFTAFDSPIVIAHRGGSTYPENTLEAFQHSFDIGADVIEFDVHITKDGHPVVIHDETVDRTTNGSGRVDQFTLLELKQLDAGYSFKDADGNFPFRNQGITIPTVREVFEKFPNRYMNIELKASSTELKTRLWELIVEFKLENNVLIASFDQNVIEGFDQIAKGTVAISAGEDEAKKFVLLHKFFLGPFYSPVVDAIQIPPKVNSFHLDDPRLIEGANKLNMPLYYWTINDEIEMKRLVKLGANGIATDRPGILIDLLEQLELR